MRYRIWYDPLTMLYSDAGVQIGEMGWWKVFCFSPDIQTRFTRTLDEALAMLQIPGSGLDVTVVF